MLRTLTRSCAVAALLSLSWIFWGCARPTPEPTPPGDGPRLVLFLVVDQARADYLVRYRPSFQQGLKRLLEESVVFADTHHDHADTTTAPGHATLSTGLYPAHHGIISNAWYDRETASSVTSVYDEEYGRSPRRLLGPTLGDWLKAASQGRSKVFGVSMKDRAAILSSGHDADGAFWYDDGELVSSSYYYDGEMPAWYEAYDGHAFLDRYFATLWEPLPEVTEGGYELKPFNRGFLDEQFPHPLGGAALVPGNSFYGGIYTSPIADRFVADFAKALVAGEGLGADGDIDLLAISFSALDAVGHSYGPDSPEVLDTLLNLDRTLGDLLDFLDQNVGLDRVVVTLSADHGVAPVPELLSEEERGEGHRLDAAEILCVQQVGRKLGERFGEGWMEKDLYLNRALLAARGFEAQEAETALRELEACPTIARVWTRTELLAGPQDPFGRLFAHSFHPDRSADAAVQLAPYSLSTRSPASHGSPYPYDTAVPWLLRLPSGRHVEVTEKVKTVDVAPTVASILGVVPPANLDGVDRGALFAGE